jgi:hypothetical protein
VKILLTLKTFKVNMSFKQVSTAELNKVVIAINIPGINKGIL